MQGLRARSRPIPDRRNDGECPVRRARMDCKIGVHLGNVGASNVRHLQAADRWQDMAAKERLVTVQCARLALRPDVGAHEFVGYLAKQWNCPGSLPLRSGVSAALDRAKKLLGFTACFVG